MSTSKKPCLSGFCAAAWIFYLGLYKPKHPSLYKPKGSSCSVFFRDCGEKCTLLMDSWIWPARLDFLKHHFWIMIRSVPKSLLCSCAAKENVACPRCFFSPPEVGSLPHLGEACSLAWGEAGGKTQILPPASHLGKACSSAWGGLRGIKRGFNLSSPTYCK